MLSSLCEEPGEKRGLEQGYAGGGHYKQGLWVLSKAAKTTAPAACHSLRSNHFPEPKMTLKHVLFGILHFVYNI